MATAILPAHFGGVPLRWHEMEATRATARDVAIYRTTVWPSHKSVVIKVFPDADQARTEFERQATGSRDRPHTPDRLIYSGQGRFIAMSHAPGEPVLAALNDHVFETIVAGPMQWIGEVHREPVDTGRKTVKAAFLNHKYLRPVHTRFPWSRPMHDRWKAYANSLPNHAAAHLHGDFHPGNIICDGARFTVIDFDKPHRGSPQRELAQFFNTMQIHGIRTGQQKMWPDRRDLMLDWYGAPEWRADPVLACAMQYWRLRTLRRIGARSNTAVQSEVIAHLRDRLSRPTDDLGSVLD